MFETITGKSDFEKREMLRAQRGANRARYAEERGTLYAKHFEADEPACSLCRERSQHVQG